MTSQSGWQLSGGAPEAYEKFIVPAWMGQWARSLVEASGIKPGDRVLDVACGTGVVSREALRVAGSTGAVVGLDINTPMLEMAKRIAEENGIPGIEWRQGSASSMPLPDAAYDVILCQQGLQYFPDPAAALREMARVAAPQGRLAISILCSLERQPFFVAVIRALEAIFGPASTGSFRIAFSLTNRDEIRSLLAEAGWRGIHVTLEVKVSRYRSVEEFVPGYLAATPIAAQVATLDDVERKRLVLEVVSAMGDYVDDGGLAAPMECHVITATR